MFFGVTWRPFVVAANIAAVGCRKLTAAKPDDVTISCGVARSVANGNVVLRIAAADVATIVSVGCSSGRRVAMSNTVSGRVASISGFNMSAETLVFDVDVAVCVASHQVGMIFDVSCDDVGESTGNDVTIHRK